MRVSGLSVQNSSVLCDATQVFIAIFELYIQNMSHLNPRLKLNQLNIDQSDSDLVVSITSFWKRVLTVNN